ncbi:hypothetical protein HS7_16690 [Sulfolobales archaeon HS-7]|nr:hypothetical protein HS7_16690 [Sulfolobales archaeon HS-7]
MLMLAELIAKRKTDKIKRQVEKLSHYDGIDIPDSPMGYPGVLPVLPACVARSVLPSEKYVIVNQRLRDINELHLHSVAVTMGSLGSWIAITQGDAPSIGTSVDHLSTEIALNVLRRYNLKVGIMLSMRKPMMDVRQRLAINADFYFVLNLEDPAELEGLDTTRMIPYFIVITEKNREMLKALPQPKFNVDALTKFIDRISSYKVMGILLSSPYDEEFLYNFGRK